MKINEFALEKSHDEHQGATPIDLSRSTAEPYKINEFLDEDECANLGEFALQYGSSNGDEGLRDDIAKLYTKRSSEEILITNGSSEANFIITSALLEAGDEMIYIIPNFMQIIGWAEAIGVIVKTSALIEEQNWALNFNHIRSLITAKTKLISICHPNSPSGAYSNNEAMNELISIATDHDLYIHSDEIFKGTEFDQIEGPSFIDLYGKAVCSSGFSKAFALPGIRIGWVAGPIEIIQKCWNVKDYTTLSPGTLNQHLAKLALMPERRKLIIERNKKILMKNRQLLVDFVRNSDNFSLVLPRAGGIAFVKINMSISSDEFCTAMRENYGVSIVPGSLYGYDKHLRFGLGGDPAKMADGLKFLTEYTETLT
ncbi:aminotransferase class I/II-fold pyridoxal phosphate-dependent enzyme [Emcibacteraceae bacterium]|nr:aminotransferase class I/II-fold pyridoxal phosphate-dependent enzyme [Emcibacteraceae bacterium]